MHNKDLEAIYNSIYRRGESTHYTKLLFAKGDLAYDRIEVLKAIPSWKGKMVLDAGCGTGELAYLIAERGAKRVIGIDYSSDAIAVAKSAHQCPNLLFQKTEIKNVRGKFDAVVCLGTLEHMDDPLAILRRFKELLKPGGSLIVSCPNWLNPRGYILTALRCLFDARITLADLHYLTPFNFMEWGKILKMELEWKTVDHEWAHGKKMIDDLSRRLPNVARDSKLGIDEKKIKLFMEWLNRHAVPFERDTDYGGAIGVYHFKKASH